MKNAFTNPCGAWKQRCAADCHRFHGYNSMAGYHGGYSV